MVVYKRRYSDSGGWWFIRDVIVMVV